ncbi:hypothetical protein, partial [Pseudomonas lopnurensis]|uniref:hypothetical protein n=1 Tax=Pseudomonas lopnurensis TaxID=1477517 RepID=UPI0028B1ECD0
QHRINSMKINIFMGLIYRSKVLTTVLPECASLCSKRKYGSALHNGRTVFAVGAVSFYASVRLTSASRNMIREAQR